MNESHCPHRFNVPQVLAVVTVASALLSVASNVFLAYWTDGNSHCASPPPRNATTVTPTTASVILSRLVAGNAPFSPLTPSIHTTTTGLSEISRGGFRELCTGVWMWVEGGAGGGGECDHGKQEANLALYASLGALAALLACSQVDPLSLFCALSISFSLSRSFSLSLTHSLFLWHTHTLSLSLFLTRCLLRFLSHAHTHTYAHICPYIHGHIYTKTVLLTQYMSLCACHDVSPLPLSRPSFSSARCLSIRTRILTDTHTHKHTQTYTLTLTDKCARTRTHMHSFSFTHSNAHAHARTRTHVLCVHIYTHRQ